MRALIPGVGRTQNETKHRTLHKWSFHCCSVFHESTTDTEPQRTLNESHKSNESNDIHIIITVRWIKCMCLFNDNLSDTWSMLCMLLYFKWIYVLLPANVCWLPVNSLAFFDFITKSTDNFNFTCVIPSREFAIGFCIQTHILFSL